MRKKFCAGCLSKIDFDEFTNCKLAKDGKRRLCKACVKIDNAKTYAKNKKRSDKSAKNRAECRAEDKVKIEPVAEKEKICLSCRQLKKIGKFTTDNSTLTRHARICIECNYRNREKDKRTKEEKDRIKNIFSVPVNFTKTQFYYMPLSSKYNAKTSRIR